MGISCWRIHSIRHDYKLASLSSRLTRPIRSSVPYLQRQQISITASSSSLHNTHGQSRAPLATQLTFPRAEAEAALAAVVGVVHRNRCHGKRTYSTYQNTRTNRSGYVSPGEEKVRPAQCTSLQVAVGVLKGYDQLLNLVLDEVQEFLRGMNLKWVLGG